MIVVRTPSELREALDEFRKSGKDLGFVPTMGALHDGHLSLVKIARQNSDLVVASIFVNPKQFGPHEDYARYPRKIDQDIELLQNESVDIVFVPDASVMYPAGSTVSVDPGPLGNVFEGAARPGHFQGVLTIVAKLLNHVQPQVAVLGQKDAQQLFLIKQMVEDLNFRTKIIEGETIRELDGLALSSRNVYLKSEERSQASALYRALVVGRSAIRAGIQSLRSIQLSMRELLASAPLVTLEYATAVNDESFEEYDPLPDQPRLIIAARLGSVRLIDNLKV
jgi:pantoate--beta-alanine ligase